MKKRKLKRLVIGISIFLLLITILGYVGFTHIAPYAMLQPQRVHLDITPADYNAKYEALDIAVSQDVSLKGHWVFNETEQNRGVIIFVHGIGGCKEHFIPLASKLSQIGISSIVFDMRAHGESGGEYTTYGFYEKQDVSALIDFVSSKQPNVPIGIWGNSLGGAVAIQSLELDKRIDFGIIESTFTNLDEIVYDYKRNFLKGFGIKWLSDYALEEAGRIANFTPSEVSPLTSVKNIEQPVFIGHGDADERISFTYGTELFENLKSEDKELEIVTGAGHFNMYEVGGETYYIKILDFIDRQLTGVN